jgi:adenylate cyclase
MRRGISYRISLVVAIPLLIVVTGAIIAVNSYLTTKRSIDALTDQVFQQVSEQAADQTRAHVLQAEPAVDLLVASISESEERGDITDDAALEAQLVDVLRANGGFEWTTFGDEHGSFVGAERRKGAILTNKSRIVNGKTEVFERIVESDGTRRLASHLTNEYDPRKRPYYVLAKREKTRVWTPPYIFFNEGAPGITCAAPVYEKDGSLRGVVTVDFGLEILSQFVRGLKLSPHGVVFLYTEPHEAILAHPTLHLVTQTGAGTSGELVTRENVGDPLVRRFFDVAATENTSGDRFDFGFHDAKWIGSVRAFPIDPKLSWYVAAAAPASDFTGPLEHITRVAIAVALVAVLLAVLMGAWLARTIARPLARMAVEMERVGGFDIAPHVPQRSVFREIKAMDRALAAMKGGLHSFAAYVPRDLVRAVLASGERAELGGKTKRLTVFFSDLAGFTTLSETLEPHALVELLGGYFDAMTRVIQSRGGTIDKFIGDAIMAFWNAPGDEPRHAALACEAALACQAKLAEMRASNPRLAGLRARIGLATGDVLVGNIGASARMNYTVMGDTVNLASRLEGLNKAYGTPVMMSETTHEASEETLLARPIDVVAVKGKARGVRVYEPIALVKDATEADRSFCAACARALDLYLARDFEGAARAWDDALAARPDDPAAKTMKTRARDFAAAPPPDDWDGTKVMHEK